MKFSVFLHPFLFSASFLLFLIIIFFLTEFSVNFFKIPFARKSVFYPPWNGRKLLFSFYMMHTEVRFPIWIPVRGTACNCAELRETVFELCEVVRNSAEVYRACHCAQNKIHLHLKKQKLIIFLRGSKSTKYITFI